MIQLDCFHDLTTESLVGCLMEARQIERPEGYEQAVIEKLTPFNAIVACGAMDERLENLSRGG